MLAKLCGYAGWLSWLSSLAILAKIPGYAVSDGLPCLIGWLAILPMLSMTASYVGWQAMLAVLSLDMLAESLAMMPGNSLWICWL
jgi:hypothetical protein